MTLLALVIVEAALELVPQGLWDHPSVLSDADRKGKKPWEILLDRSLHHRAMVMLKDDFRRGRPDLVHFALLEATSSPLYMEGHLEIHVHCYDDKVISIGRKVRLPKSYFRFEGLMEQLLSEEGASHSGSPPLLSVRKCTFEALMKEIQPSVSIGFSRIGKPILVEEVFKNFILEKKVALVFGGFPRGHFTERVTRSLDRLLSVHPLPLEVHTVIARVIYDWERARKRESREGKARD